MKIRGITLAAAVCALTTTGAQALLSVNVLQDNTTLPGWVINTFTVDSDTNLTVAAALTDLSSGSMLQVPGFYSPTRSNGLGDSYIDINGDLSTSWGLTVGDLTQPEAPPPATFDSAGIATVWSNIRFGDIGTGMHLATLTFSDDAAGGLELWTGTAQGILKNMYTLDGGLFSLSSSIPPPPIPDPPIDPDPLPDPDPGTTPGTGPPNPIPYPDTGSGAVPEPVGLGIFGAFVAVVGGLHRRRLV